MNELKHFPYSAHKFKIFGSCKYRFKLKVIDKVKEKDDAKFFEKGKFIHSALAAHPNPVDFKFKLSSPSEIQGYKDTLVKILTDSEVLGMLANKNAGRERTFRISFDWKSIDQKGQPIKYWIKDNTLFWGEIDYIGKDSDGLFIVDWKTGKVYPDQSDDQLKVYALWLFLMAPESIEQIRASFFYVEHGKQITRTYYRKDLESLMGYFHDKINKIEHETTFAKTPSKSCEYCGYFEVCKPFNIDMEKYNGDKMASHCP